MAFLGGWRRSLRGLGDAGDTKADAIEPQIGRPDAATPKERKRVPKKCIVMNKAERIKRELGLTSLPEPVRKFGEFMIRQSEKEITPRDVVKAYTVTRSSIQRQGRRAETLRERWPDHPFTGNDIRPEDAFAYLLQTPDGKTYLDEAQTGILTDRGIEAARRISTRHDSFGFGNTLFRDMTEHAPMLAKQTKKLAHTLRTGTKRQWANFAEKYLWGISHAKKGFLPALLGRGDLPTADARELKTWWENIGEFSDYEKGKHTPEFAKLLEKRLVEMDIETPPELRPFYQHLAHHAVWDAASGTQTTHADVMSCMILAGLFER